jgi:transporter family protein
MWILLAFLSAALLGFYDVFKKRALRDNAVIPVLLINTVLCSLFFLPLIVGSSAGMLAAGDAAYVPAGGWREHGYVVLKSLIVLSSWLCGYFAIKHLPLTIVGPVNASRPVMTLVGALLIFGEQLNLWQWVGVLLALLSFYLLNRSGKKEGIDFVHNRWVFFLFLAAILGACSGLYDKYLLSPMSAGGAGLDKMFVQGWYNLYQALMMLAVTLLLWWPTSHRTTPFSWRWSIVCISVFLTLADLAYFYALSMPGVLISVVSMVRRSSVLVSFLFGALVFHEKNLKAKALDLLLVLLGVLFLYFGTEA